MYKIAVLGPYDSIYGFATLGLDIFPVQDAASGAASFRRIVEEEYAIVYITEGLAASLTREIEACRDKMLPAVILIPGISGNTGAGVQNVKKSVEQAVGSDILFGN